MRAFARYCAEFGLSRKAEAGLLVRLQGQGVVFGDVQLFVVLGPSMGGDCVCRLGIVHRSKCRRVVFSLLSCSLNCVALSRSVGARRGVCVVWWDGRCGSAL